MRKGLLIAIIIAIGCAVLFAFTRSRNTAPAAQNSRRSGRGGAGLGAGQPIPVAVAPAVRKDMPVYVDGLGSVEAFYTVVLKPRVGGEVTGVYLQGRAER